MSTKRISATVLRRNRDEWKACAKRAHAEIRRLTAAITAAMPERGSNLARAISERYDFALRSEAEPWNINAVSGGLPAAGKTYTERAGSQPESKGE